MRGTCRPGVCLGVSWDNCMLQGAEAAGCTGLTMDGQGILGLIAAAATAQDESSSRDLH
jgi:hypothetical protein